MRSLYFALSPWLVFVVADRSAGLGVADAAYLAGALGAGVLAVDLFHRKWRGTPVVALVVFGVFAAVSDSPALKAIGANSRAIATGVLALYLALTVFAVPQTLRYCPVESARTPCRRGDRFRVHRRLTLRWSISMGLTSLSLVVGALTGTPFMTTLFDWLIPIALVCYATSAGGEASPEPDASEEAASMEAVLDGLLNESPRETYWPIRANGGATISQLKGRSA